MSPPFKFPFKFTPGQAWPAGRAHFAKCPSGAASPAPASPQRPLCTPTHTHIHASYTAPARVPALPAPASAPAPAPALPYAAHTARGPQRGSIGMRSACALASRGHAGTGTSSTSTCRSIITLLFTSFHAQARSSPSPRRFKSKEVTAPVQRSPSFLRPPTPSSGPRPSRPPSPSRRRASFRPPRRPPRRAPRRTPRRPPLSAEHARALCYYSKLCSKL